MKLQVAMLGDDRSQIASLRKALLTSGHSARRYDTAIEFLDAVGKGSFDLLILGYHSPDLTALEVLAHLRLGLNVTIPIIVLTPHRGEHYVVTALRAGADDCIGTPVGEREFLARVETIMRRAAVPALPSFVAGKLIVNIESRQIFLEGKLVQLTNKDFNLAVFILRNSGKVLSRDQIMRAVWGWEKPIKSRTLDTHMSRLRTRLMLTQKNGWRLAAVYRIGYRLERVESPVAARRR